MTNKISGTKGVNKQTIGTTRQRVIYFPAISGLQLEPTIIRQILSSRRQLDVEPLNYLRHSYQKHNSVTVLTDSLYSVLYKSDSLHISCLKLTYFFCRTRRLCCLENYEGYSLCCHVNSKTTSKWMPTSSFDRETKTMELIMFEKKLKCKWFLIIIWDDSLGVFTIRTNCWILKSSLEMLQIWFQFLSPCCVWNTGREKG